MLDHITIHVSDFERSRAFYLSALAALGYVARKTFETDMGFGVGEPDNENNPGGEFWIHEGTPARRACMWPSAPAAAKRSTRSIAPPWRPAAATTARPACARITTPTITAPSSWTPTATTSRPFVTASLDRRARLGMPQRR